MATSKSRAATVRQRHAEAREYAERHGTPIRLDRRTVRVKLTNEDIEKQVRALFKEPKKRLPGGKRGTESTRLRRNADFRLTLVDREGRTMGQSGPLRFQYFAGKQGESERARRAREREALIHTLRRANNGVFNLFTDYASLKGKVAVTNAGEFEVDGERWDIVIEPDVEGEPLLPKFQGGEA